MRSTAGFALFAYQALNSSEAVHIVQSSSQVESEKMTSKLQNDANRATKVFHMKGSSNSSEVRRPVAICMNVMSTVFCRKVLASFSFFFLHSTPLSSTPTQMPSFVLPSLVGIKKRKEKKRKEKKRKERKKERKKAVLCSSLNPT